MTEKEYEKWTKNMGNTNNCIREYGENLERLKEVYNAFSDKHHELYRAVIEFEYKSEKFGDSHEYYFTNNEKVISCIKSEIKNEIEKYEKLLSDSKNTRMKLISSLLIKE